MDLFPDLTIATTIHNNLDRWMEMATSFEREAGWPAEIVAVDDGSATPARPEGLRSPLRMLRNETARGFGGASDQALKAVTTPFALLLDADITFLPGDFSAAFAAFKAQPRLAWSNFQQVSIEGRGGGSTEEIIPPGWVYALGNPISQRWVHRAEKRLRPEMLGERIQAVPIAHSSSAFVRMEAFRQIGGFDLAFWQCQSDNDVCLRLGAAGWKVGVDRLYTVRHDGVGGKTGGARRVYDLYRGKLLLYERHRPATRLYLRPLLALRHVGEALAASFLPRRAEENLQPAFRWRLAASALRGYPAEPKNVR
jgi:N-acetylglucosaminyl-diphospho-decaprenol L-rhamnosyltransferase